MSISSPKNKNCVYASYGASCIILDLENEKQAPQP
jgi:hypothetical protein